MVMVAVLMVGFTVPEDGLDISNVNCSFEASYKKSFIMSTRMAMIRAFGRNSRLWFLIGMKSESARADPGKVFTSVVIQIEIAIHVLYIFIDQTNSGRAANYRKGYQKNQ